MLTADLIDIPVDVLGGYCPAIAESVLPPGAARLAQDCYFPEGAVQTRPGLLAIFGPSGGVLPSGVTINGLKTYLTPTIDHRLMVWDSAGNLYKESPDGTLTLLFARPQGATTLYQSSTLFGREYQAFYAYADPNLGLDIPRQYDDTNWDRVSQVGPGAAPLAQDEVDNPINIHAAATGLTQPHVTVVPMSESGNVVTATIPAPVITALAVGDSLTVTSAAEPNYNGTFTILGIDKPNAHIFFQIVPAGLGPVADGVIDLSIIAVILAAGGTPYTVGELITIAGAGVAGYNGTGSVRYNDPGLAFFYVAIPTATIAMGASGGGMITTAGSIIVGRHGVSVAFITRQGFITQPAPPNFWSATGGHRVTLSKIATGPYNVIARLLIFTPVITAPATTGTFYSLPNGVPQIFSSAMLIPDNTTIITTIDFTDVTLIAGFNAQYLFTQLELGECASVNGYNNRLAWCGERNKINNFLNLTFDGGWSIGGGPGASDVPLGWTADPVAGFAGIDSAGPSNLLSDWGDAYRIVGNGLGNRGMITQPAYQDYLGVSILSINISYSVRIRVLKNNTIIAGSAAVEVFSPSAGSQGLFKVPVANMSTTQFTEFIGVLMTAKVTLPSDIVLRVYLGDVATNNGSIIIDSIEVFPTLQPYNFSTARISHSFNPESYDATTGAVQIRPNDGQMLHASFPIRGNLYFGKDHYLCYVTDDGVNEPASWAVNEVSATIGICGPNAVDWTEEWAVFAERSGLYIFWGSDPIKITPEIQSDASGTGKITWNSINWDKSQSIWVRIDRVNKQILVGAPVGSNDGVRASLPNVVFMLDYKWLDGAQDIAASPMVTYSAFTGKVLAHGRGRRWMIWNIKAASMWFAERTDGTVQAFYGSSVTNGKVYEQLATQLSDDGVAINSSYSTYFSPSHTEEQVVQLGAHRKLLGYLKWLAYGSGILSLAVTTSQRTTNLRGYILSTAPTGDGGRGVEISGERFSYTFGTNAVGSWFRLEQLVPCLKKHPVSVVRGVNA